jgi:LuxR family transcriptional regulator, regulator of acetate metabolism
MHSQDRTGVRPVVRADPVTPVADVLLELDAQFAEVLGVLDRAEAVRRIVARVPELVGVDVAWVGEPDGADRIVLGQTVNSLGAIEGLVVPVGVGLGGQVLASRRPLWVSDYIGASDISEHFKGGCAVEGIKAMIAVPIIGAGQLRGVLYAANRRETAFGDRTTLALEQVAARTAAAEVVAERARHAADVAVHEERRRLSLELHDTVGAMLFTIGAGIRRLGAEPGLDAEFRSRLSTVEQQAMEAAAVLRGSLRALNAAPEQVALGVALREHCRAFEARTGVVARLITVTDLPALDASRVGALADAVREGLLNVEKHARARSVVVTVFATGDRVGITVCDDGVGLPADRDPPAGLGLAAVRDRLSRVGGSLAVSPNDDRGVVLHAWLPA